MPAQPAWFHRLEEIFTAPRAMTSTHLDRLAVSREALIARLEQTAKLFELSRAMANDWPAFCRSVEENLPAPVRQDAFHRATSGRARRWKV